MGRCALTPTAARPPPKNVREQQRKTHLAGASRPGSVAGQPAGNVAAGSVAGSSGNSEPPACCSSSPLRCWPSLATHHQSARVRANVAANSPSRCLSLRPTAHVGAGIPFRFDIHQGISPHNCDFTEAKRVRYDAYGKRSVYAPNLTALGGTGIGQNVTLTGRYIDSETGLVYFRARQYSTGLGRFIGRDPLEYFDSINFYKSNIGINGLDPWGLFTISLATDAILEIKDLTNNTSPLGQTTAGLTAPKTTCYCIDPEATSKQYSLEKSETTLTIMIHFWKDISLYASYRSGLTVEWVRRKEMDHVKDLKTWMGNTAQTVGDQAENIQKPLKFNTKAECEKAATLAIYRALDASLDEAKARSKIEWDDSGKHTWPN